MTHQAISSVVEGLGATLGSLRTLPSTIAGRLFLDRNAEFWLRELGGTSSLREVRARVVDVIAETSDAKTFLLRPNALWGGHLAGQHTILEVEIDGTRVRRCYSISSAPSNGTVSITVKRLVGGRVSGWLHTNLKAGSVVTLQPAAGEFVLSKHAAGKLMMLGGGSGITPVMSMLRDLDNRRGIHDLVFVHCAHSRDEAIFASAVETIAERNPGLRVVSFFADDRRSRGRFDEEKLTALVPDFAERDTFLCGPPGLMQRVERLWGEHGAADRLHRERFVAPAAALGISAPAVAMEIKLASSGRIVRASAPGMLLEQLERGGGEPAYGCRMGICQTCKCRKKSGSVQNVLTGIVSNEPDEDIQPCISLALSDLELDL